MVLFFGYLGFFNVFLFGFVVFIFYFIGVERFDGFIFFQFGFIIGKGQIKLFDFLLFSGFYGFKLDEYFYSQSIMLF